MLLHVRVMDLFSFVFWVVTKTPILNWVSVVGGMRTTQPCRFVTLVYNLVVVWCCWFHSAIYVCVQCTVPVILCTCLYDVWVGDVWCDNQHGYLTPFDRSSVDGIVLPGTWANGNVCPLLWTFCESLFLGWFHEPLNYQQWCWWGVADGPFFLMLYGEEWLCGNCKTWQTVQLLKLIPIYVRLWRRWWAHLHCWIFLRRGLLGRSVRLLDSVLVFPRGSMRQSVMQESCHVQCIVL